MAWLECLLIIGWLRDPDPDLVMRFPRMLTAAEWETLRKVRLHCYPTRPVQRYRQAAP